MIDFYPSGELLSEVYYSGEEMEKELNLADRETFEMSKQTMKYFKRIPTGTWTYYKRDGAVWKTIVFDERRFIK